MTCDDARLALGSLVLGALADQEAAQVREHLRSCAACRADYDELADMPRLMGLVPIAEATHGPPVVPPALRDELVRTLAVERARQRRRRVARTAVGGVGLAAIGAAIGFGVADGTTVEAPVPPATQVLAATDSDTGVWGRVVLDGVAWGTRLDLELSGVTPGETCQLVAITADGVREVTSTWTVPAVAPESGYLSVPGATGLTPDLIDTFEVVAGDGRTLLSLDQGDEVADEPDREATGTRGAVFTDDARAGY